MNREKENTVTCSKFYFNATQFGERTYVMWTNNDYTKNKN